MKNNPIQFAIVREDPCLEARIIRENKYQKILIIGSGGCTALHLKTINPDLHLTVFDANPAQLDLLSQKVKALNEGDTTRFNVGEGTSTGFNACGNFESLFSMWRAFIHEFVATEKDLLDIVLNNKPTEDIFNNPYWKTSFELFFSDALLVTMFTENAIQHAPKGSYPGYFQSIFETGLIRIDRAHNFHFHHILFGYYFKNALPSYLGNSCKKQIKIDHTILASAHEITDFSAYDFISFSNIFDWMPQEKSAEIIDAIQRTMPSGAGFLLRQLNNDRGYNWGDGFSTHSIDSFADRSLFYNAITFFKKG